MGNLGETIIRVGRFELQERLDRADTTVDERCAVRARHRPHLHTAGDALPELAVRENGAQLRHALGAPGAPAAPLAQAQPFERFKRIHPELRLLRHGRGPQGGPQTRQTPS